MAAISSAAAVVPAAVASVSAKPVAGFTGLRKSAASTFGKAPASFSQRTVSNGATVSMMQVWNPLNNKKFETMSYLPPLSADGIARQIDYLLQQGWIPCIEFDHEGFVTREYNSGPGYYDGRYWTMWKLPLFGCTNSQQVLQEIGEAKRSYPNAFIRVIGFDAQRQVQCAGFIVQRPDQQNQGMNQNMNQGRNYY
eukprot:jgi/Chlat1/9225/Chrsp99S08505